MYKAHVCIFHRHNDADRDLNILPIDVMSQGDNISTEMSRDSCDRSLGTSI